MVCPDGSQGSQASGGFDVPDQTDDLKRRSFDDCDCLDFFEFIEFGFGSVDGSEDVGHAGLEASEGSEVRSLGGVISREGSYFSSVMLGSFSGNESEMAFSGLTVLSV